MFLCKFVLFVFVSLILDKLGLILFLLPHVFLFLFLFVTNAVIFIITINVYDKENVHVLLVFWWTCWTCFLSNSCLLFQKSGYQPVAFFPFLFTMNLKDCFTDLWRSCIYIQIVSIFSSWFLPFFIFYQYIHPFIHLFIQSLNHLFLCSFSIYLSIIHY